MKEINLADESKLFKDLKDIYEQKGISKESFFEGINIANTYEKEERLYLLYRLKRMSGEAVGNDISKAIIAVINFFFNIDNKYSFYVAVIEASLEQ